MRTVSQVAGCGSYLPARVVTNQELATRVDTSDEWIVERSGIRQRHIAAEGELTSDLAVAASRKALEAAGVDAADLDLLIVATTTPDRTFPATATTVQAKLGMTKGAAFDIQAVCSGFVYGLSVADNFIKCGQAKNALVIGAETMSRVLDWEDRSTCVLFGDGAGAVLLKAAQVNGGASDHRSNLQRGVISTHLHSDGRYNDILNTDGGVSATKTVGYLRMDGKDVFRHAVVNLASVLVETIEHNGLKISDVDWLVPHQANKRIIDGTAKKLGLNTDKVIVTIERHANTSSASIPLALDEGVRDGRIKQGDLVLVEAMGAGLTWGAGLIRW